MNQLPVIAAIFSGFFALLAAIVAAVVTVTVTQYRASVDEKLARLRGEIEATSAQRREAVDKELASFEENSQIRLKIADGRLPAYKAIWQCMTFVSPTASIPLPPEVRGNLDDVLRKAFYEEGSGLMLSHAALSKYIEAIDILQDEKREDEKVRRAFSELRTQMKKDLSIYTEDEAKRSVRNGDEITRLTLAD